MSEIQQQVFAEQEAFTKMELMLYDVCKAVARREELMLDVCEAVAREELLLDVCEAVARSEDDDAESNASTTEPACGVDGQSSDYSSDSFAPLPREETLILLDFDDTLFPTTWVQRICPTRSVHWLDEEQKASLRLVAQRAKALLEAAKQCGRVVIVTNAQEGWVQYSCKKFMPELLEAVRDVKVVSARSTYEEPGLSEPMIWKYKAFQAEVDALIREQDYTSARLNLLSLGDSMYEQEALLTVAEGLPNCMAKCIKFVEKPDVEELAEEHQLLLQCFDQLVAYDGNLDYVIGAD